MSVFNPGRLKDIARYTAPQVIIPGSGQYDYGSTGGQGRPVPPVGAYPSGAPQPGTGLAGRLSDDGDDDDSSSSPVLGYAIAAAGIIAVFWMFELFDTTKTAIKTAPKIIPFLGS